MVLIFVSEKYIAIDNRSLWRLNVGGVMTYNELLFVELAVTTAGCSHRVGDPS